MVIVTGHLIVDPGRRDEYVAGSAAVVAAARATAGCCDFAVSADVLDPARVNILERWTTQEAVNAFRGSGPSDDQAAEIVSGEVREYDVAAERNLF